MTEKALASVIIPVYNRELLVEDAIKSVYHQSYRPIECIVVDDGSTDQSVIIIEELKTKFNAEDFSIIIYQQKNAGAPAARNVGIKNASGAYIHFLDSDDLLYADKLETQIDFLSKNKNYDAVYGDWHHGTSNDYNYIKGEQWEDTLLQFYGGRVIANFSMLLRKSLVEKIGLWDEGLKRNQEIDYFLRGVLVGGQFGYLPNPTGLWREHDGERIVSSNGAIHTLAFHNKWIEIFHKQNLFNESLKKNAALNLFWNILEIEDENMALHYLIKADTLYPSIPELNTFKMKLLKVFLGTNKSLKMWYKKAKN
jgi:glycosyltransferase involved in cell wall biosynthesis